MLNIKFDYNTSHDCFDRMTMMLFKDMNLERNLIPTNIYETKKLVSRLSLGRKKIYCCINGYTLYYKGDENEKSCKFCDTPQYKETRKGKGRYKMWLLRVALTTMCFYKIG